ncbi:MAG: hypothetical protein GC162_09450 [Planctomycetes bacterium]|nr:hypothetical protein [Planctomycetota bacterium]
MAWNPFSKKKAADGDDAAAGSDDAVQTDVAESGSDKAGAKDAKGAAEEHQRDPRRAQPWFDRGKTVADTGNYDYAIECYISGLKFDPESIRHHEALREVALRRRANGGKPAGMKDQFKHSGGKTSIDKMLNAEFLWAKNPLDPGLALAVMNGSAKAELDEVTYWIGEITLDLNRQSKKPSMTVYLKARDNFAKVGAFDMAVEACRFVLAMEPNNMKLVQEYKNLEAEKTIMEGRYGEEGGSFRTALKDADKAKALAQSDSIAATGDQLTELIARLRKEYEEKLDDIERLQKLVRALLQKGDKASQDEAIKWLEDGFERFGQYMFKMQVGEIRIKQFAAARREYEAKLATADTDEAKAEVAEQIRRIKAAQLKFEVGEFQDRVKAYPTDMRWRFELGKRQFLMREFDAAIASFQEAQSDPKYRAMSLRYLGEAFALKDWVDEAIDTYHRAIEVHPYNDDRLALELRYNLMCALEAKARREKDVAIAQEAAKIASQIAQADINYHDIRQRIEMLRKLTTDLKEGRDPS